jgi:signal transduction histidine kinase
LTALQKTVWGLAAIGLTFLLAIAANIWHAYRLNEVKNWTIHTHFVITELKDTLIGLEEVETSVRGYVISKNPLYISTYEKGKVATYAHLEHTDELLNDNPLQQERLKVARKLADQKIAFGQELIDIYRLKLPNPYTGKGKGTAIMDAFKANLALMIQTEDGLLKERTDALLTIQRINWLVTGLLAVFLLGTLSWVYTVARRAIAEEQATVTALLNEIEDRKRIENDLTAMASRLASSNTDLQQFAYVASHDLQEPLRAVAGFLTLIVSKNKGRLDPETDAWIDHAVQGAQRMRALINDLLSYARVESQGKPLVRTSCNAALQRAKENLSVLLEETNTKIKAEDLPEVAGDESQLGQLFQNLLSNAVKFRSQEEPLINIRVVKRDGDWIISMQDNGMGFDEEHAKRIFVIFQRLHGRDEYKGTGIGLALCKKIVERHSGRIWAQSQPGKGSIFSFTIPVVNEKTAQDTLIKAKPGDTLSGLIGVDKKDQPAAHPAD